MLFHTCPAERNIASCLAGLGVVLIEKLPQNPAPPRSQTTIIQTSRITTITMANSIESRLRNRFAVPNTVQPTLDMSHAMEEEPMSQYDLDEETVMTPVQTRAVSPSRGRVMPHTAAEADAFTASLNTIVNGKDNGPAHAALSLFDKTRAFFNTFSLVDKAAFILYITVFTLTMAGIQVANYGVSPRYRSTVCG